LSFGNSGKVTTAFFPSTSGVIFTDIVWSLALQPDGKVVAAGKVDQNPPQEGIHSVFGLARYNPDGSLDQSFGSGGKVVTDFFPDSDAAYSVSIQHDGKIVAVGAVAVMRYNPDGSLDASFGSGGKVATPLAHGSQLSAAAAVLQPDGRIVLGGNVMGALTYNFALARFNTDGSIDSGFGSGGSVVTEFPGQVLALALEGDGRIVAAGTNTFNFTLARYNADGSLDQTFGSSGLVNTDISGSGFDSANKIAIQPDGKIVAVGDGVFASGAALVVARYNSDGSRDMAFGSSGIAMIPKGSGHAVAIQPDGKILAGGSLEGPFSVLSFLLVRFNPDGSLDTGFGSSGVATTRLIDDGRCYAMELEPEGRVVLAGTSYDLANSHAAFALARFQVTGIPPEGFGLVADPSAITLSRGDKAVLGVNILRQGGFAGAVTVTAPDASGMRIRISPSSGSTTGSRLEFTCKVKGKAVPGHYTLSFVGADDSGHTQSCTLAINVQ